MVTRVAFHTRLSVALVALALMIAGCSGPRGSVNSSNDHSGPSATAALPDRAKEPASPFPEVTNQQTPLPPGTYTTTSFKPGFTIRLAEPGGIYSQGLDAVQVNSGRIDHPGIERTLLALPFSGRVINPRDDRSIVRTGNLIRWLDDNPHLKTLAGPAPVTVGGIKGQQIDLKAVKPPPRSYFQDGSRSWNVIPLGEGDPFSPAAVANGEMFVIGTNPEGPGTLLNRVAVVTVHGRTVVLTWTDPESSFHDSTRTFEQLLKSIEWE